MSTQAVAMEKIAGGRNIFVSGGAGRGKSYLIDQVYDSDTILAAPTGIAALNIGGATCHSVFALPIGLATRADETTIPYRMRELFENGDIRRIIIDEIGNLRPDILDLINKRLQLMSGSSKPFGGIQLVGVGDLYQIEPVVSRREEMHFQKKGYNSKFCFSAKCWDFESVILTKNYRQTDTAQSAILDSIRVQDDNFLDAIEQLKATVKKYEHSEDIIHLCCYNDDADRINAESYARVKGPEVTYTGEFKGDMTSKDVVVDQTLKLKLGAKVLIKANNSVAGYCNGDRGTVVDFTCDSEGKDAVAVELDGRVVLVTENRWEKFKYTSKKGNLEKEASGSFKQMPLRLGYGISVHSSQGLTLDDVAIDFGKGAFAHGMGYVAISRVRNLNNLMFKKRQTTKQFLKNFKISEDVRAFYAGQ